MCERAWKKSILHRKNALFSKTRNGARVGDLFLSLIYTCQLNELNPFDYLTELQQHTEALAVCPEQWMPWNHRGALGGPDARRFGAGPIESIANRRSHHQGEQRSCPGARPGPAKRLHPCSDLRPRPRCARP